MSLLESSHIDELAALLAVSEHGSFIAASRALQRHQTIVSKRIAALERRLGVRLIERTTRRVRLTEAGKLLADRLRSAADLIGQAEQEALDGAIELRGTLRVAVPAAMGRLWLAPAIPKLMQRFPNLDIEIDYAERYVDLIGEGFDAAIRLGSLSDSRLVARKLGEHRVVFAASPQYCERHGFPSSPRDMRHHSMLEYTGPVVSREIRLTDGDRHESFLPKGRFRSNDIMALLEAARGGMGVVCAGNWLTARDFASGRLVRVLRGWNFESPGGVYLVKPSGDFTPAKTEAFASWIGEMFAMGSPWDALSLQQVD